ncbi:hypothetical protein DRN41_00310 [Thermococci archaeon]|nr:MAG: hypothetical protein DRN41_00310 [Thermococci archaeon]
METEETSVVWIQGQGCSGCSISFLLGEHPDILELVTGEFPPIKVKVHYHPTIMTEWGDTAFKKLEKLPEPFVLVIEGSIPTKDNGTYCLVGEKNGDPVTFLEVVKELANKASAVVAVGTCATFGGIPAGKPNPTGAKGVSEVLGKEYKSLLGLPVVNVPGCPPHPDWVSGTLVHLILAVKGILPLPQLDEYQRPLEFFGKSVHENCPLAGFFTEGTFAKKFGEEGCTLLLGCKGPVTRGDCPARKWNGKVNACTISGSVCIGCTDPEFPDAMSPLIYYPAKPIPEFIPPSTMAILLYGYGLKGELEKRIKEWMKLARGSY